MCSFQLLRTFLHEISSKKYAVHYNAIACKSKIVSYQVLTVVVKFKDFRVT